MKVKKPIKKAQNGLPPKDLFDKNYDTLKSAAKQIKGIKTDKTSMSERDKRVKEGYFTQDPKSGDLIPTAKYFADRKSGKKMPVSKNGASLKPVDSSKNPGLAKLPTPVRNKMGYQKDGGKTKAKSGAALKKQAAVAIAMKKAGKAPKKKMQYGGSAASMAPKKAMGGMKMMKGGGKCKYGC